MGNQKLYESLLMEVKGELNFKQIQELKTLKNTQLIHEISTIDLKCTEE